MIFKFARSHLITVISREKAGRFDWIHRGIYGISCTQLNWNGQNGPSKTNRLRTEQKPNPKTAMSYALTGRAPGATFAAYIVYSIQPTTRPHRDKPSATSPLARCHRLGYSQPHRHRAGQANCHTQPHYTTSSPFTLPGGLDEVYLRYESGTWQASRRMRVHAPAKASHARSSGKTLNTRALRSPGGA